MRRSIFFVICAMLIGCVSRTPDNATALDFSKLAKNPSNPFLLKTQSWCTGENHEPSIVKKGGNYYMFHGGSEVVGINPIKIGVRITTEAAYPYGWSFYDNNPVLVNNLQPFSSVLVSAPHPYQMPDNSWRMYYHGYDGTYARLGFATTSDANFPGGWTTYEGNPLFTVGSPGTWDDADLRPAGCIIPPWEAPDNVWHNIYGGYDGATWRGGQATSADGITWNRDVTNPIIPLGPGGAFDSAHVLPVGYVKVGGVFYIFYDGSDNTKWEIGYYTTTDFVTFTRGTSTNPLITVGASGEWDKTMVEGTGPVYHADTGLLDIWYVGTDEAFILNGSTNYRIGLATIQNGTLKGSMLGNVR